MEDLRTWAAKILIPAMIGISIKLAVMSKGKTLSLSNAVISFVTGVGFAYLLSDWVLSSVSDKYAQIVIASIAISGDRIGYWAVHKFNIESILEGLVEKFKKK